MPPPSYSPGGVGRYGGDIGRYKGYTREIQGRSRGDMAPGAAAVVLGGRRESDVEGEEGKVHVHRQRVVSGGGVVLDDERLVDA